LVLVLATLSILGAVYAEEPGTRGPSYFDGFDPNVPAPETYRGWPTPEILEQFYGISWSQRAFRRAALFGQPVFFVLTVNWNRAGQELARTALQDAEVLHRLNQGYITVLVNADLRPDIRERYQTGGWPVLAFLLPDGNPMLSRVNERGVAKPITTSAVDRDSLLFLLREASVYWGRQRESLLTGGARWAAEEGPDPPEPGAVQAPASEVMARWLLGNADREQGGFGAGAKYLVPALDEYAGVREARGLPALRAHSRLTLEILVSSPLFDRREGGMHRLATAPDFGKIQYEKMLTGNGQLLRELVGSLRRAESTELRLALKKTAGFIVDKLGRDPSGFYLAQGADPDSDDGGGYWKRGGKGEPPPVDRLVLSGPNAIAGAAVLRAGLFLDDPQLIARGRSALDLVHEQAVLSGRGVGHAIEPVRDPRVYLTTLADVALAFLDGYETTGQPRDLLAAREIVDFARANLKDPKDTTYRDHLPSPSALGLLVNERRPLRSNVRLARAMLRLALHRQGEVYRDEAVATLANFTGDLSLYGVHGIEAALAVEEAIAEPLRIRIEGPVDAPGASALRRAAANAFSRVSPIATPHGLLCLTMTAAGASNSRASRQAASRSRMLLNDSSLPCNWRTPAMVPRPPSMPARETAGVPSRACASCRARN